MAKKSVIADSSNIEFLFGSNHSVSKVRAKDGFCFINELVESEKPIFDISQDIDGVHCQELVTNNAFIYAISSACISLSGKILDLRTDEKKEEQREPRIKEVDEAIKVFREKNEGNEKYIVTKYVMQPATRFYVGKQGDYLAKASQLDKLKNEELIALTAFFKTGKAKAASLIRESGESGWLKQKTDYTPEGWREVETIKYNKLYEIKKIDKNEFNKKLEWIESFDFHPGWNYEGKISEDTEVVELDELTENCIVTINEFSKEFVFNAINKDKIISVI